MAKAAKKAAKRRKAPETAPGGRPVEVGRVQDLVPGERGIETVVRVVDVVGAMVARGLLDRAQVEAARRWERAFGIVASSGHVRIDPGSPGGRGGSDVPLARLEAADELARARVVVGDLADAVFHLVLGEGHGIEAVAAALFPCGGDAPRRDDVRFVSRVFRENLTVLARAWGYASPVAAVSPLTLRRG